MLHRMEPQQQMIQPSPVPEQWTAGLQMMSDGEQMVVILITNATGQRYSFLPPESAIAIGQAITNAGRQASSGIILPPPGFTPPNGHK